MSTGLIITITLLRSNILVSVQLLTDLYSRMASYGDGVLLIFFWTNGDTISWMEINRDLLVSKKYSGVPENRLSINSNQLFSRQNGNKLIFNKISHTNTTLALQHIILLNCLKLENMASMEFTLTVLT